jgi:hypothetical protein
LSTILQLRQLLIAQSEQRLQALQVLLEQRNALILLAQGILKRHLRLRRCQRRRPICLPRARQAGLGEL